MTITSAIIKRAMCFPLRYLTVPSGSHTSCTELSGYLKVAEERDKMIVRRSFAYDNNIRVAKTAMGFFLPINWVNLVDLSLIIMIMTARKIK